MQPTGNQDYKQLLTEVIKKQIVILGPDITLSKARNVKGLTVADDGTVTNVEGAPQEVTQALIDQFVQLSGLIVKKTMEPLLSLSQAPMQPAATAQPATPTPVGTAPVSTTPAAVPQQPTTVAPAQNAQAAIDSAMQQPATATQQPAAPTPTPAKNPLAA